MKFLLPLSAIDMVQIQQQRQRRLRVLRQELDAVDREQTQLERKGVDLEKQLRSKVCMFPRYCTQWAGYRWCCLNNVQEREKEMFNRLR